MILRRLFFLAVFVNVSAFKLSFPCFIACTLLADVYVGVMHGWLWAFTLKECRRNNKRCTFFCSKLRSNFNQLHLWRHLLLLFYTVYHYHCVVIFSGPVESLVDCSLDNRMENRVRLITLVSGMACLLSLIQ